jgi:hypothetical protein
MLSWVSIAPLGYAVVPEVNWMSSTSSGETEVSWYRFFGMPPVTSTASEKPICRTIAPKYVWREFRRFGRGAAEQSIPESHLILQIPLY